MQTILPPFFFCQILSELKQRNYTFTPLSNLDSLRRGALIRVGPKLPPLGFPKWPPLPQSGYFVTRADQKEQTRERRKGEQNWIPCLFWWAWNELELKHRAKFSLQNFSSTKLSRQVNFIAICFFKRHNEFSLIGKEGQELFFDRPTFLPMKNWEKKVQKKHVTKFFLCLWTRQDRFSQKMLPLCRGNHLV